MVDFSKLDELYKLYPPFDVFKHRKAQKDLSKQIFGRLKVLYKTELRQNAAYKYLCICECNNLVLINSNSLVNNYTKSCGCILKEIMNKKLHNQKEFGESSFNGLFSRYKQNAKRRNIYFGLTKEQFKELTKGKCSYCGIEPFLNYNCDKTAYGYYTYNGIDRIDPKKGYILGNVTSCCKNCNYAKRGMQYHEFMDWIRKVYEYSLM